MPEAVLERRVLTKEEVISMLPDGNIHTFRQAGNTLIGADWERNSMLKAINKYEVELTGEQAASMGHGMAFCDDLGWVFVQTK